VQHDGGGWRCRVACRFYVLCALLGRLLLRLLAIQLDVISTELPLTNLAAGRHRPSGFAFAHPGDRSARSCMDRMRLCRERYACGIILRRITCRALVIPGKDFVIQYTQVKLRIGYDLANYYGIFFD
jgi:hypothetical protein